MSTNLEIVKLAVQSHLVEYAALRQELLEMIKWRDRLVFLSLSVSGALLSFSFSASAGAQPDIAARRLALYLVAPLSSAIGGLWFVNAWRIYRIAGYLRDVVGLQINSLLNASDLGPHARIEVLSWEKSGQRIQHKWSRRLVEWLILVVSFVSTGLIAQFLIVHGQKGSLWQRALHAEMPMLFFINFAMIGACGVLLVNHLFAGLKHRPVSTIKTPDAGS